jgi:hypothetical protein
VRISTRSTCMFVPFPIMSKMVFNSSPTTTIVFHVMKFKTQHTPIPKNSLVRTKRDTKESCFTQGERNLRLVAVLPAILACIPGSAHTHKEWYYDQHGTETHLCSNNVQKNSQLVLPLLRQ